MPPPHGKSLTHPLPTQGAHGADCPAPPGNTDGANGAHRGPFTHLFVCLFVY